MAVLSLPVILWHTLAARPVVPVECGNSEITVFSPILEISLNCSLLETILPHKESTIVST